MVNLKSKTSLRNLRNHEMLKIGEIWVESAMSLSAKELKTMQRLVRSQDRIAKSLVVSESSAKFVETAR